MRSAAYHRPHLFQYTLQECAHVHVSRVLAHAYVRVRPLSRSPSLSLFFPLSPVSLSLLSSLSLSLLFLSPFFPLSRSLSRSLSHTFSLARSLPPISQSERRMCPLFVWTVDQCKQPCLSVTQPLHSAPPMLVHPSNRTPFHSYTRDPDF